MEVDFNKAEKSNLDINKNFIKIIMIPKITI